MAATSGSKTIIALSKAEYRHQWIYETADGFVVIMGGKQYDPCNTLSEAVALIDTAFSMVLADPRLAQENEIAQ